MGLDDEAGAVGEVGGRLQLRLGREEDLEFPRCIGRGFAPDDCWMGLIGAELLPDAADEVLHLGNAVVRKHLEGQHQIRSQQRGQLCEIRPSLVPLQNLLGLVSAQPRHLQVGQRETGLLDCVQDLPRAEVGVRSDEHERPALDIIYLLRCTSNLVRVN